MRILGQVATIAKQGNNALDRFTTNMRVLRTIAERNALRRTHGMSNSRGAFLAKAYRKPLNPVRAATHYGVSPSQIVRWIRDPGTPLIAK